MLNTLQDTAGRRSWRLAAAAAIACAAVGLAACGSDDEEDSAASGATSEAAAPSALGAEKPAKGDPIVVGLINMEGGGLGSFPELHDAAEAAVSYVNTYKGGIHGKPLKIDYCATTGDPASSATCANRFVDSKPVAVMGGADLGTVGSLPILEKQKIPYIGGDPFSAPEFTASNSIQFIGTARSLFTGEGAYVGTSGAKRVAVIGYDDIPSGKDASAGVTAALKANGATDVVNVGRSAKATDETQAMAAAAKAKPEVIIDINAGQTCVSAIKSARTLAPAAKLFVTGQCLDPKTLASVGSAAEGLLLTSTFVPVDDTSNPDVALFGAAMKKYAPKAAQIETAVTGFSTVMNLADAMNAIPDGELTSASLMDWFKQTKDQKNFMSNPYTCDGRYESSPALCNGGVRVLELKGGKVTAVDDTWYDGMKYFPAGT